VRSLNKYLILCCLYFSQGLPFGFFKQALPTIMRERGASLPQIGLASLLVLPWALKFLWAPLVDRYGIGRLGNKRSWILCLQAVSIPLFVVMGLVDHAGDYQYLMYGFFIANFIAAIHDIPAGGLAVSLLITSERGFRTAASSPGSQFGMLFGGGFILLAFALLQWRGSFFTIAAALALATVPLLFYREPTAPVSVESDPATAPLPWLRLLSARLCRPGFLGWLLVIAIYKFGDAMASEMLRPYLVDRGLDLADIGELLGTAGFFAGLVGALAGGYLVTFVGRYHSVVWFGLLQAITVFSYYLLTQDLLSNASLYVICSLEIFCGSMATAAIFTAMMDVCDVAHGATDYTLQASAVVVSVGLAGVLAGFVAGALGYALLFLLSVALNLGGIGLFAVRHRRQPTADVISLEP